MRLINSTPNLNEMKEKEESYAEITQEKSIKH